MFDLGRLSELTESIGRSTAHRMEPRGDILNGMDAVEEGDDWVNPILEKAHALWPQSDASHV
jgi:hypothetical protein